MNDSAQLFIATLQILLLTLLSLLIYGGALALLHFLLSLPLRRAERVRFFLDLVETALRRGQPLEQTLIGIAHTRDMSLGSSFRNFALWLERGLRFDAALAHSPWLLPPQIVEMLKAGVSVGDLRKVLPACRRLLADAISETRSAMNYLVVLLFVVSPVAMVVFIMLFITVFPRFSEIGYGLGVGSPIAIDWILSFRPLLVGSHLLLQLTLCAAAIAYIAGPRLRSLIPGHDRVSWLLPWQRKRLQRDFSTLLATLLDSGMPEPQAVTLAASCTRNSVFQKRAARVVAALQQGQTLTQAMQCLDDTGEFQWRLTNAAHAKQGFLAALAGWHDALNAKAFQQQQAAAHTVSTALVLLNGTFVAMAVISVFAFLISIIDTASLW